MRQSLNVLVVDDENRENEGDFVVTLKPEKRVYTVRNFPTTEAGIHTLLSGDLYATVGDAKGDGSYVTRIYFNPLVKINLF